MVLVLGFRIVMEFSNTKVCGQLPGSFSASLICLQATSVANLLKDEVAEGHRQLVALATAAASAQGAREATAALTVQDLETRQDPTVEISSMLRQSRCGNHSTLHTAHTNSLPCHSTTLHQHYMGATKGVRPSIALCSGGSHLMLVEKFCLLAHRLEEAFSLALSASNVDVVSWLCAQVETSIMSQVQSLPSCRSGQQSLQQIERPPSEITPVA